MLVNNDSSSELAIKSLQSKPVTSLAKIKDCNTVDSMLVSVNKPEL